MVHIGLKVHPPDSKSVKNAYIRIASSYTIHLMTTSKQTQIEMKSVHCQRNVYEFFRKVMTKCC